LTRLKLRLQERNVLVFVLVRGLSLTAPLLTLPVLSRAIGPRGFGLIAFAQSVAMYGTNIIDFGFNITGISSVAELHHSPVALRQLFWSVNAVRALLMCGWLAVLLPVALTNRVSGEGAVLGMSSLLLLGCLLTPAWLYQGLERASSFAMLSLAPRLAVFPLILIFVRTPSQTALAAGIAFGAEALAGGMLFGYAWMRLIPGRPQFAWTVARRETVTAFDPWLGTVATTFSSNLNPLILRHLAGLQAVGVFSAADRLVRAVYSFYYPVVQAYQASVTRSWSQGDLRLAQLTTKRVAALLAAVSLTMLLAAQFFGAWMIRVLFGPAFQASVAVLRIESLWLLFAGAAAVLVYLRYVARHQGRRLRSRYLLAAVVQCLLLLPLVHYLSAAGAAIASVLAQAALTGALWLGGRRFDRQP
jgi:PST family polysaccharide transporter